MLQIVHRRVYSLLSRFLFSYLLLLLLPVLFLSMLTYRFAAESSITGMLNARREALITEAAYIQSCFQQVEEKYYSFKSSASLRDILQHTANSERSVIYEYQREVENLLAESKTGVDAIDDIRVYTTNEIAAALLSEFDLYGDALRQSLANFTGGSLPKALYQRFWQATEQNGVLKLTYWAGLMSNHYVLSVDGLLAITCNAGLLRGAVDSRERETYIYQNGHLFAAGETTDQGRAALERQIAVYLEDPTNAVLLDRDTRLTVEVLNITGKNMLICRVLSMEAPFHWPSFFLPALGLMLLTSVAVISAVLHPMRKLLRLSQHMRDQSSTTLTPFPETESTWEIGTVIREYNALVQRTNQLSQAMRQNEEQLRNAQIERLQSQLNPHFFYGTLENIRMVAEINGQPMIAEIAYNFAELMRYSLSRDFFVPVEREMDVVRQYIDIQQKRLGNRFTVAWDICGDLSAWLCPKFVLFSLVENAFSHDVSHSRRTVHIQICLQVQNEDLSISVENDGPGIPEERLQKLRYLIDHPEERVRMESPFNGRSVFNIADRLRFYYGDDYTFSIHSQPNVRTVCRVRINRNARFMGKEETPC